MSDIVVDKVKRLLAGALIEAEKHDLDVCVNCPFGEKSGNDNCVYRCLWMTITHLIGPEDLYEFREKEDENSEA